MPWLTEAESTRRDVENKKKKKMKKKVMKNNSSKSLFGQEKSVAEETETCAEHPATWPPNGRALDS